MSILIRIFTWQFIFLLIQSGWNYGSAQQIKFKHLTVESGLSHNTVNCMIQDNTGFIWFGTQDGLNRFDGYNFRVFRHINGNPQSLSDNDIWALFQDRKGNIWVGTKNGILNCFNPDKEIFTHHYLTRDKNFQSNSITSICQDSSGQLWIGTYKGGLYNFDPETGRIRNWRHDPGNPASLSNKYVTSVFRDIRNNLWIGTYNGLCLFNKNTSDRPFIRYFSQPDDMFSLSHNIIWRIYQSPSDSDHIWIGTYNGLTYLNTEKKLFTSIIPDKNNPELLSRSVSSVFEYNSGTEKFLWIGTYGGLLKMRLPAGFTTQVLPSALSDSLLRSSDLQFEFTRWKNNPASQYSLNNNLINYITRDKSGVLWIIGQKGVDYYLLGKDKFSFNSKSGYEDVDFSILEFSDIQAITQTNDETLWFGTTTGLFFLKKYGKRVILNRTSFLSKQNIWSLYSGNHNDLWAGTYGNGLYHIRPESFLVNNWKGNWFDKYDIGNSYVRSVLQDRSGYVWLGFWGVGLNRLDPATGNIKRWFHDADDPESLSYDDVWVIFQDSKDRIWIGTYGGGLNLFNPSGQGKFYKWIQTTGSDSGLTDNNILSIIESNDLKAEYDNNTTLWVGTSNGLNKLMINNDQISVAKPKVKISKYLTRLDLSANAINSIVEDLSGYLWLTTNNGLVKFDPAKGVINTFKASDGLQSNEFNPNSSYLLNSGEVIVGSTKGPNIFHPDSIHQSDYKPNIVLTDFQIFSKPVTVNSGSVLKKAVTYAEEIVLSHYQNVFSFQFSSLDYNAPEKINYAYMMEGFDDEWIYSGNRHFVTYTNLDPGRYIFRVKATNNDGIWNEDGIKLSILITPPFWKTWWAYTVYTIIFIFTLFSIRNAEIRKREKREEERLLREKEGALLREAKLKTIALEKEKELEKQKIRNRIAQDLHDEIGSNLSSISLMSELIQKNGKINPEVLQKINRIMIVAKGSTQAMRDIVWLTNPSSDNIKDLVTKMNEVANDMLDELNWTLNFPEVLSESYLSPEIKRNVFFIYKECLNNIVKHSDAKRINMKIKITGGNIFLGISDDGKGFQKEFISNGNGLRNMSSRAAEFSGKLRISSIPGKGTSMGLILNIT